MLNNKKEIIILTFLLISLPFIEFGLDYFFGDKDGTIIRFHISKIITIFQFIALTIITISLYKTNRLYCLFFLLINYLIFDFKIFDRIFYNYEYIHRYPHPYVGFTGKPNKEQHNQFGFIGPNLNEAKSDDFVIAFFGGSTGYRGDPNLPIMIENILEENNFMNGKVFISNFSAESSNHNQHLHMLIEFVLDFKVDLVLFYGGWNETVAQAYYDPRPGYPINFFYIHHEPHWKKFLIENSKVFGLLQHKIVDKKKFRQVVYSKKWNKDIIDNYFNTLNKAKNIVEILEPNSSTNTDFIAFYQPFNIEEAKKIIPIHNQIKDQSSNLYWLYDVSDVLSEIDNSYTDAIHVKQHARKIIAEVISGEIIKSYP